MSLANGNGTLRSSRQSVGGISYGNRVSSEVSVNNYPEHLNPFYGDENHKRLRFLKISLPKKLKRDNGAPKVERRTSFSLDGIKDMWRLKSFRMNKKSSTLGINKTSESPPPLRRDLVKENLSPSNRNTVADPFQRNVSYRSSLQTTNGYQQENNSFIRNNRNRSTMATTTSSAYITPTPRIRFAANRNTAAGSSQLSVNTNPFDEDDDTGSVSGLSVTSLPNRPRRKKRRAPLPPISSTHVIDGDVPVESITTSPKRNSPTPPTSDKEAEEIHNLTQEIQTFVSHSQEDEHDKKPVEIVVTTPNNTELKIVESIENIPETVKSLTKAEEAEKAERKASDPYTNVVLEMEKYDVRFVPLKEDDATIDDDHSRRQLESQRSVKEIIESINKSQSLLKINHEENQKKHGHSTESLNSKMKELERKEQKINNMLKEIEFESKVNELKITEDVSENEINEIPVVIRDLQSHISKLEDSGNLFEKCSSPDKRSSADLDWNPLPKPRRTQLPSDS